MTVQEETQAWRIVDEGWGGLRPTSRRCPSLPTAASTSPSTTS